MEILNQWDNCLEVLKMFAKKVANPTPEILARVRKTNMKRANYIARQKKIEAAKVAAAAVALAAKPVKTLSPRAQRRHARKAEEALEM
jgi:hypothetical protein